MPLTLDEISLINKRLASDFEGQLIQAGPPRVDTFRLPYAKFDGFFTMPAVPLDGPDLAVCQQILDCLQQRLPAWVAGTNLLPEVRPVRDARQLHFVQEYQADENKYLYILRLHLDYMGGATPGEILQEARQDLTPIYHSDRLYYQARILPIKRVERHDGWIVDFEADQIKETLFEVSSNDTQRDLWSSVLFDDVDFSHLQDKFLDYFKFGSQWQPGRLFYPFVVDSLTLGLNLLDPHPICRESLLPNFNAAYTAFKSNPPEWNPAAAQQQFWSEYASAFNKQLAPARSGNPHWIFENWPNRAWFEEQGAASR
ncbi:MAG: hypothetical protein KDK39_00045 [Leptospiraceae bacterium]|nr:hypothetical protein [Leptospiraceae bacterium]